MAAHVVVVGAGAVGASAAMYAAGLGAEVTLIEREYPASGSSSLSLGVFNRQTTHPEELELRIRSIELLRKLERDGDLPLEQTGYLRLARRPGDMERFAETLERQVALGYDGGRLLDAAGVADRVPDLRTDDIFGGLYGDEDGTFDGHLVCGAYIAAAEAEGARLRVRTALTGADRGGDRITLQTTTGEIECDRVINAAGAWAGKVGEILGAPVPLIIQRHQITMAKLSTPLTYTMPTTNEYVPGSGDFALVLRQESSERLLAMLHSHEVVEGEEPVSDPDDYAKSVPFDYVEQVAMRLADRLPGLADSLSLDAGWAGLYPLSPDGQVIVGPYAADPRIVAAAGVGGVGITISGAVGRLAADWAVHGETTAFPFADRLLPDRLSAPSGTHL
jgi:sarcosine oxidase subunit beta